VGSPVVYDGEEVTPCVPRSLQHLHIGEIRRRLPGGGRVDRSLVSLACGLTQHELAVDGAECLTPSTDIQWRPLDVVASDGEVAAVGVHLDVATPIAPLGEFAFDDDVVTSSPP
jgi:hypothetical protein